MSFYQRQLQPRLLNAVMGTTSSRETRARVCAGLAGDVVEIGYGSGLNQPHLPAQVTGVWAVDPSSVGLQLAAERRAQSSIPVVVGAGDAQDLPFPDDRFDAALSTWTLCGIADPAAALRELARVLKPGSTLHFVEHGLAPDDSVTRWQRRGNGLNRRIAGCFLDRDIRWLLESSSLTMTSLDTYYEKGSPKAAGYLYEGRATA